MPEGKHDRPSDHATLVHLPSCGRYEGLYVRISAGHFVVSAAAGDEYEYDRATSSVRSQNLRRPNVPGILMT